MVAEMSLDAMAWPDRRGVLADPPTFAPGDVVELSANVEGYRGDPTVLEVTRCQPAGQSGWGYLVGYLPGCQYVCRYFLRLDQVHAATAVQGR
jgi:hypothetical protein